MSTAPSITAALPLPSGLRATKALQAMLALLPEQPVDGWTEALVEAALRTRDVGVNRVTVYRALDRLVQAGVLQRVVDAERVTRYFIANSVQAGQPMPQLECRGCHQHFKLGEGSAAVQSAMQALRQALAHSAGVRNPSLDIQVHGECAQCADADHRGTSEAAPSF